MKFNATKKVVVEEFPVKDRELVQRFAQVLNPFMDQVAKVLAQVTIADNLKSQTWRLDLPIGVSTYTVSWPMNEKPTEVRIANCRLWETNGAPASTFALSWALNNSGGIELTFLGLDAAKRHLITVVGQV